MNKKKFLSAVTIATVAISNPNSGAPSSELYSVLQSRNIIRNVPPSNEELYEDSLFNISGETFMNEKDMNEKERLARLEEKVANLEARDVATKQDIQLLLSEIKTFRNITEEKLGKLETKVEKIDIIETDLKWIKWIGYLILAGVLIPLFNKLLGFLISSAAKHPQ